MRHYIRHPVDIPIEIRKAAEPVDANGENISVGGLALRCGNRLDTGNIVRVRIPFVQPIFEMNARVAWCRECDDSFEVGLEFLDADDAFRARMVEQVCSIESYRKNVYETEQRSLSASAAALEWIEKHASTFPRPAQEDTH